MARRQTIFGTKWLAAVWVCACTAAPTPTQSPARGAAGRHSAARYDARFEAHPNARRNARPNSQPNPQPNPRSSAAPPHSGFADEVNEADELRSGQPETKQAIAQKRSTVVLPSDEAWVAAPIPAGNAAQYARWRQLGQTHLGTGYLRFLELLDQRRLIVKSAADPYVRILDLATRRELNRWPIVNLGQDDDHAVLAWRGSGEPGVLIGKADGLSLHVAESGSLVTQLTSRRVDSAGWSDDGRVLVTAEFAIPEQTARLRLYQVEKNGLRLVSEMPETERVDAWALSRDNRYLARVYYPSDTVSVVDLHTGLVVLEAPVQRYVGSVEFSPNGRWLALGGEGIKWFDLSAPTRRAQYTHFYNNVADIEFSPSGDVLATAAFDGRIRLLTYDEPANRLAVSKTFTHQTNTNVYALKFVNAGRVLVSSGGDQTVRYWSADAPVSASSSRERWQNPAQWAEWGKRGQPPPAAATPKISNEHYVPARLSAPPRSSRIAPGEYECKVSESYKLRRCSVEIDESGHTMLEFTKENLLGLRGVLYDDGSVVRFEGWLTDGGALGCANCAHQPLHAVFRGSGNHWNGLLLYRPHYDPHVAVEPPVADAVIEEAIDRFPLVLRRK